MSISFIPFMVNFGLEYRNSSCHLGFCPRFTSRAWGHKICKDKQEIPSGLGEWSGPLLPRS